MSDNNITNKSNISIKENIKELNNKNQENVENSSFSPKRTILERDKLITNRTYFYLKK